MKRRYATLLLAFLSAQAFCLDLTVDVGLTDKSYFRYESESGARQTESVSLGQGIGEHLYVNLELWHSNLLTLDEGRFCVPAEQDYTLSIEYAADPMTAGLLSTVYATDLRSRVDIAAFADCSIPIAGDLASLDAGLSVATDLTGLYCEASCGPTLCLPLGKPILIGVECKAGLVALGYDGINYNGLSTLTLKPKISASLSDALSLAAFGGYCFDLSGGAFTPYPFVGAKCSLSLGT